MRSALLLIAAVLASSACKRPEDEAARKRIFSPEEPIGTDAKAREKLDARRLADDDKLAERVLRMSRAEAATRLGAHKLTARTEFTWTMGEAIPADAGGNEVSLIEDTSLQQSQGGDFQARMENDKNQGFEAVSVGGEIFVRSRYGPFRQRRTDRADVQRLREQTSASLATFDQLARGLKLRLGGDTRVEGRPAIRYEVAGAGVRPQPAADADLPPLQWPEPAGAPKGTKPGPDVDTARRLSLWEKEQPVSIGGNVVVDAETAAPLAYELRGRFKVDQPKGPPAELALKTTLKTSAVGKAAAIKKPAFEPEPSVPHAVKDPLRFLGRDAGVAGGPQADDDEEAAEEPPAGGTPAPAAGGATPAATKNKPR